MSVLFKALDRAAEEEAHKALPGPGAEIIPLFAPTPKHKFRRGLMLGLVLMALGGGLAAGAYLLPAKDSSAQVASDIPVAPVAKPAPSGDKPALANRNLASGASSRPGHVRSVQANSDGIALPVEALKEMQDAEQAFPASGRSSQKGDALSEKKLSKKEKLAAKRAAKHVVVTENKDAPPDLALSEAHDLLEAGKVRPALQRFEAILAKNPSDRAALDGKVYALQQMPGAEAAATLEKMTRSLPDYAPAFAGLARAEAKRGNDTASLAAWRKAVALDGGSNVYRLSLAILYDRLQQSEAALAAYRALPKPWPKQVEDRVAYLSGAADKKTPDDPASSDAAPSPENPATP